MRKLRCVVVDDEPLAVSLLSSYVQKVPFLDLIFSTENPLDALDFIKNNDADLVFLDIQMPELTGIHFMEIVGNKLKYILTTAYAEFALDGFEHHVVDYLLKPISFERFYKSVVKAQERFEILQSHEETYFFVKSSGQMHKVQFSDILYVESIKDYVNIKTQEQEFIVLDTLKSMAEKLPSSFIRVHKSYIINRHKISSFGTKDIVLGEDNVLPIGESYKMQLMQLIKKP